ncbi:MAG: class I SAM-dependent methyltransferase [Oceanipulchritudo sp.]
MDDHANLSIPDTLTEIEIATRALDFQMASDHLTGSLLRTLVASKRSGRILELGTGTGLSSCWILDGMDDSARLTTVDNDEKVVSVAIEYLSSDSRVKFHVEDGSAFLRKLDKGSYDLIFADTWPGKYWDLDLALELLADGGLYLIDDMLPQESWPEDHAPKVERLIKELESRSDLATTKLNWSTGIILVSHRNTKYACEQR